MREAQPLGSIHHRHSVHLCPAELYPAPLPYMGGPAIMGRGIAVPPGAGIMPYAVGAGPGIIPYPGCAGIMPYPVGATMGRGAMPYAPIIGPPIIGPPIMGPPIMGPPIMGPLGAGVGAGAGLPEYAAMMAAFLSVAGAGPPPPRDMLPKASSSPCVLGAGAGRVDPVPKKSKSSAPAVPTERTPPRVGALPLGGAIGLADTLGASVAVD
jgi:hypothetical protein